MKFHKIKIGNISLNNRDSLVLIAGPCVIESKNHAEETAHSLKELTKKLGIGFIYKSSFDKANRTSIKGFRGPGIFKGLDILDRIKSKYNCPILTDVHDVDQCAIAGEVVDILQIPAFLCRQTDIIIAASQTGRVVNIKKGQFLAPWDITNVIKKIEDSGNKKIILTERGVSFGYGSLVSDMRSIPILAKTGYPVIFDATHSVQQPGVLGASSGGQSCFVPTLARAAVAIGIAGIFMETHQNPQRAPSDGSNMIPLKNMQSLLKLLLKIDKLAKSNPVDLGSVD
jgi:2-dehydro-3-deoxyphosphooctonate aldolase (KDO 8-P synthase)